MTGVSATETTSPASPVREGAPPEAVGSKVIQPKSLKATSAHWWAWFDCTVWGWSVWVTAQPETTRAGIPTDLASTTKAVLNCPQVPFLLPKRNQSAGSWPRSGWLSPGSAKA